MVVRHANDLTKFIACSLHFQKAIFHFDWWRKFNKNLLKVLTIFIQILPSNSGAVRKAKFGSGREQVNQKSQNEVQIYINRFLPRILILS